MSDAVIEPDQSKLKVILEMPRPKDKKGVLKILGMINFIVHSSYQTCPQRLDI